MRERAGEGESEGENLTAMARQRVGEREGLRREREGESKWVG